jgi:DNA-binding CsgD family transcriptional regulator/tetratricopeptide (TPR) repeat protein
MSRGDRLPILVGREREMAEISAAIDEAARGRGRLVLIQGEAGIGKTTILAGALDRAADRGFTVFRGSAEELDRTRPFGPLADTLACHRRSNDPARARIAELLYGAAAEHADGPGTQFRVVEAIGELIEEATEHRPVALAIEDLHWADPSTLLTIRSLFRRSGSLPLLLVGTLRPIPRPDELEVLLRTGEEHGVTRLDVRALDDAAVRTIVERMLASSAGPGLLEQVSRGAGNPLFVIELIAALQEQGAVTVRNGVADVEAATMPPTLRLTILRRVSTLGSDVLELLGTAAILGSSFAMTDLAAVAGRSALETARALQDALSAGVLGEGSDERLVFRHDLIREAIYEDIPASIRKAIHREAAVRLVALGVPTTQVAQHFLLGAADGDREAIEWLHRGGREVAASAPAIAVELLERALQLAGSLASLHRQISIDLIGPLAWTGRLNAAEALARDLLAVTDEPSTKARLYRSLAESLAWQGRHREAYAELERATALDLNDWERASVLAEFANAALTPDRYESIRAKAGRAAELARRSRNYSALVVALVTMAWPLQDDSRLREARPVFEEAVDAGRRAIAAGGHQERPIFALASALFGYASLLADEDQLPDAERHYRRVCALCEETGAVTFWPAAVAGLLNALFVAGRWDDAIAEIETASTRFAGVDVGRDVLATIAAMRGDTPAAERYLEALSPHPQVQFGYFTWARALVAETRGDLALARDIYADAWGAHGMGSTILPDYVRVALASGDPQLPDDLVRTWEERAQRADTPTMRGVAAQLRGLVDDDPDVLLQAVEQLRDSPRPLTRAHACADAASALTRHGRVAASEPLFHEALQIYEDLRSDRCVARTTAVMREAGLRPGVRRSRKRPESGWDSLTKSELDVVRLVATGLRNADVAHRLFISPRTVQAHLSHVFAKLGLSSRAELVADATRRSDASP